VLSGTINGVRGDAAVSVTYASLSAKHRARAWVLALALAANGDGARAISVGRRGARALRSTIVAPGEPRAALTDLLDLYDRGMCEPLPLAAKTSATYAASRIGGASVEQATADASRDWRSDFGGEQDDRHHRHVWGDAAALADLLAAEPLPDEQWRGEPTRFGELACRLWQPILQAEKRR